jgi:hypothetical protein
MQSDRAVSGNPHGKDGKNVEYRKNRVDENLSAEKT